MSSWMLYGANGYTGRLIAEHARERGLSPILAGRNREAIEAMGRSLSLPTRVCSLEELGANLHDVHSLLLAAGPFSQTSERAVRACLAKGVNYLDITGEISIFEAMRARAEEAKVAKIALLPGVGFDVVPTDCLATTLHRQLPNATHLELAFSGGEASRGTTKTMIEHLGDGGAIRENGRIRKVPMAFDAKDISYHDKPRYSVTIPWGDVSTAHHSTGIPNIRVYMAASRSRVKQMKVVGAVAPILRFSPIRKGIQKLIDIKMDGPSEEARASRKTELWGCARNDKGAYVEATLTTPEAYRLTAMSAVESARRGRDLVPGFQTPSTAFGADYIQSFEGCTLRL